MIIDQTLICQVGAVVVTAIVAYCAASRRFKAAVDKFDEVAFMIRELADFLEAVQDIIDEGATEDEIQILLDEGQELIDAIKELIY